MIPVITAAPKKLRTKITNEFRFMTPSSTCDRESKSKPYRFVETLYQLTPVRGADFAVV